MGGEYFRKPLYVYIIVLSSTTEVYCEGLVFFILPSGTAVEGTASQCLRRYYRRPGLIPGCITTGCDWSHRAANNWPSIVWVWPV